MKSLLRIFIFAGMLLFGALINSSCTSNSSNFINAFFPTPGTPGLQPYTWTPTPIQSPTASFTPTPNTTI